jgi:hypothetical protein
MGVWYKLISFLYKNLIKSAVGITESESSPDPGWGTANIFDDSLNSAYRSDVHYFTSGAGTTTLEFNLGSAIFADSIVVVSNLTKYGTMWLTAGTGPGNVAETFGVPLDSSGTSHKYFWNQYVTDPPQAYQYWKLWFQGVTAIGVHQINEVFLGRRNLVQEMPSYPFENGVEENITELVTEKGQKYIYSNYERETYTFNFEGVNSTTESSLWNMYKYVKKNTQPFFMNLDNTKPMDTKFVRFSDKGFLSEEITKNVYDLTIELQKEI